jgi:hypothetical protein
MIEESAAHALLEAAPARAEQSVATEQVVQEVQVEVAHERSRLVNIALFLAAPFIGLVYALMLPAVGMAMVIGMGAKAVAAKYPGFAKVATFAAAPFIGLVFAVSLPLIGAALLIKVAAQAAMAKAPAQ